MSIENWIVEAAMALPQGSSGILRRQAGASISPHTFQHKSESGCKEDLLPYHLLLPLALAFTSA